MNKLVIATTAAIMFSVSGTALAGGSTTKIIDDANATAGAISGAQGIVAGETPVINIEIDQSQPETRGLEQSQITQDIKYSGEYTIKSAPNVSAPALTTTMTETCMGSTSAGGSMPGFGLSFGTTWRDGACVRRLDARELNSLGYRLGAKELMCDSANVREALARAGTPCYEDLPNEAKRPEDRAVVAPVVVPAEEESPALGYQGFDVLNMSY